MSGPSMTPSDVLRAAADKLIRDGWTQGSDNWLNSHGPCCILGALVEAEADSDDPQMWHAARLARNALDARLLADFWPRLLMKWNDVPGRTADDVIRALLETAADLEDAS